jgi:alpha-galactosidase
MPVVTLNGGIGQLVGKGASNVEYRTHFSPWATVASPLLIGADAWGMDNHSLNPHEPRNYRYKI